MKKYPGHKWWKVGLPVVSGSAYSMEHPPLCYDVLQSGWIVDFLFMLLFIVHNSEQKFGKIWKNLNFAIFFDAIVSTVNKSVL